MLQFGYNTGVINAPESVIEKFIRYAYRQRLEPVIRMSPEHISVEILKFEFNLGSNWKMRCCSGQTHS